MVRLAVMSVSSNDLERRLAKVRAVAGTPREGVFGPRSHVWRVNREAIVFAGGGRAALLQLAHPFVAQAIADHSTTRQDPLGRFVRTFEHVFAMVYGDLDAALASARRVHALHERIRGRLAASTGSWAAGTPYLANDPAALCWVHATLWDTAVQVYELVMGPLAADVRAAYYEETKRFAWLFGVPDDVLPPTWDAFRRYCDATMAGPTLAVSALAREMADFLLHPSRSRVPLLWRWNAVVTAGLLPERLRAEYGLAFGPAEAAVFAASIRWLRATWRLTPAPLRFLPAYLDAQRRLAGGTQPHPMVGIMDGALRLLLR